MKRLNAYLTGKAEAKSLEIRIRKVEQAISAATLNFESDQNDAELRIEKYAKQLADCDCVNTTLQDLSDAFSDLNAAKRGVERMKEITEYLNEDIKVEK